MRQRRDRRIQNFASALVQCAEHRAARAGWHGVHAAAIRGEEQRLSDQCVNGEIGERAGCLRI
jgi:hypothetical protein